MSQSEEKALEQDITQDSDFWAYISVFREAKAAGWQREGGTITECNRSIYKVLKRHFYLKDK